jgi:hypothetical protein
LTTAWGVNAGYEHFWLPQWRTPLYGGYTNVKYNGQANAILCSLQGSGTGVGNLAVGAATTIGRAGGLAQVPSGTSPKISIWALTLPT